MIGRCLFNIFSAAQKAKKARKAKLRVEFKPSPVTLATCIFLLRVARATAVVTAQKRG